MNTRIQLHASLVAIVGVLAARDTLAQSSQPPSSSAAPADASTLTAAPPPAAPVVSQPDVPDILLRLRNGTVLRGHAHRTEQGGIEFRAADGTVLHLDDSQIGDESPESEPATTTPSSDRVPVEVTSAGDTLRVGYGLGETIHAPNARGLEVLGQFVCSTPCTLWVKPGLFQLYTGGPGHWDLNTYMTATDEGIRIRMNAGHSGAIYGALTLQIIGTLALTAGAFVAIIPAFDRSNTPWMAIGLPIASAGALMIAGGAVLNARNTTGVNSFRRGRAPRAALRVGVAPTSGGAGAWVGGVF